MEHLRSECKVKKDGKQLPEVNLQCDNLLKKLQHLRESLERINKIKELEENAKNCNKS